MKVTMKDGAVPFVITFRKILEKPKLKRQRRFVGPGQFVKNLILKTIELVEDAAFETQTEVVDPGRTVAVHWAVSVEDPWDVSSNEANLIAFRMDGDRPPCGAHFEIISPDQPTRPPARQDTYQTELSPEQFNQVAAGSSYQDERLSRPQQMWSRPADPAYIPRPVEPLVREDGEPVNVLSEDTGYIEDLIDDDHEDRDDLADERTLF